MKGTGTSVEPPARGKPGRKRRPGHRSRPRSQAPKGHNGRKGRHARARPRSKRWSYWRGIGSYGTLGLELVLSILLGLFVGRWADGKLGTSPLLTLVGCGFGLAAAIRAVWRVLREAQREMENDGWRESQTDRPARFALDQAAPTDEEPSDDLADSD